MASTLPNLSTRTRLRTNPLELWHLLSLDAPTVAVLWTWFIAAAAHIALPLNSLVAMGLAVWMLYASDRLLDARLLDARLLDARHLAGNPLQAGDLEQRHHFHHRHRSAFLAAILAATVALAILIPRLSPAANHLYLALGAPLAGYFLLIHAAGSAHRLPKEIAVGFFFSAAVFIPTISRAPDLRPHLLPQAVLFALLCSLNCLYIYRWEHTSAHLSSSKPHAATRLALRHLDALAAVLLLADLLVLTLRHSFTHDGRWPVPTACAISIAGLLFLHRNRRRISAVHLRASADLALLSPLLLLPSLLNLSS